MRTLHSKPETHLFSNIILKLTKPSSCTKHDSGTRCYCLKKPKTRARHKRTFISTHIYMWCGTRLNILSEYNILFHLFLCITNFIHATKSIFLVSAWAIASYSLCKNCFNFFINESRMRLMMCVLWTQMSTQNTATRD